MPTSLVMKIGKVDTVIKVCVVMDISECVVNQDVIVKANESCCT